MEAKNQTNNVSGELIKLEGQWKSYARLWHATHWVLLLLSISTSIAILIIPSIPALESFTPYVTIIVPISTLLLTTLKPSNRATAFITSYRILYFALLKYKSNLYSIEELIQQAEIGERVISQAGYVPEVNSANESETSSNNTP